MVGPNSTLFTVSGGTRLDVEITPDESHLGQLHIGQTAAVVLEAFPEDVLPATVSEVAPQVDPGRGTVRVRLSFDATPPEWVRPDMTATVEVELGHSSEALVLPVALVQDRQTATPWVLCAPANHLERCPVTLGLEGTSDVEVLTGIDEDTLVVNIDAPLTATVGAPVKPQPPTPAFAVD